jgi:hypothetical protein
MFAGFDAWLDATSQGRPYCHTCRNTGIRYEDRNTGTSDDDSEYFRDQFCQCELGRAKRHDRVERQRAERDAKERAGAEARAQGICDECFGKDPARSRCFLCNTTGRYFTEEQACGDCRGLGKLRCLGDRICLLCNGTGVPKLRRGTVSSAGDTLRRERVANPA